MPVETRSRAALAMRDIQAIEESVPRVRDALLTSAKKVAASARSRPTSPVPVLESTTATAVGPTETPRRSVESVARVASDASAAAADVSASDRSASPIPPPTPAILPSRPRELTLDVPASPRAREDGTRSTPGTPPSHRKTRLIPALDLAAETPGARDPDAHTPAHVTEMHISQFAESLRALRDLGLSGIRDLDGSFREASEEQESEQMRVLLEERSRAREMVRKLERDKEMQAEQLRMMEERMIDQELTEEELAALEEELDRARADAADAARAKSALEAELARQIEMGEAWSRRLREAEEGEKKLTASAEKANRALAEKEAEVEGLSSRLGDLERELDALRRRNTNEPVDADPNADPNADPKTPAGRKLRRVVAVDGTPPPKETADDVEEKSSRANRGVSSRRATSFAAAAAVAVAAAAVASVSARGGAAEALSAVHAAATAAARYASPTMVVRVPEAEEYPTAERVVAPPIDEEAEVDGEPAGVESEREATVEPSEVVEMEPVAVAVDEVVVENQPETVVVENQPETAVVENQPETVVVDESPEMAVVEKQPETVVEEKQPETVVVEKQPETVVVDEQPEASASPVDTPSRDETTETKPSRRPRPVVVDPALEAAKAAARAAEEKAVAERAEKEAAAARAAAEAEKEAAAKAKAEAEAAAEAAAAAAAAAEISESEPASRRPPVISPADVASRATEDRGWDASVSKGWDAWRRLGGSDRRARVKTAARRAESAVDVAKQSWSMHVEAAERYADLLDRIEAHSGEAAERQRLTFASHEADAERAGSARRWESMRSKATQAVRALEVELRAVGE